MKSWKASTLIGSFKIVNLTHWTCPFQSSGTRVQLLKSAISNRPNNLDASTFSLEGRNRPSFLNVVFFRILNDGERSKAQQF
jgi:hypothetical protein